MLLLLLAAAIGVVIEQRVMSTVFRNVPDASGLPPTQEDCGSAANRL
jgi:hypothetical protein